MRLAPVTCVRRFDLLVADLAVVIHLHFEIRVIEEMRQVVGKEIVHGIQHLPHCCVP